MRGLLDVEVKNIDLFIIYFDYSLHSGNQFCIQHQNREQGLPISWVWLQTLVAGVGDGT